MKTVVTKFKDEKLYTSIRENQVVAFPTETVYGLGVIYNSEEAFINLVNVKNRRPDKPFTLMLGNKEDIEKYADFSRKTKKIIDELMPGEITLLLKPKEGLFSWVTLGSKYIGVRVPASEEVCNMINKVNEPMLVSSANISNEPVCQIFEEVYDKFNDKVAIIVKGEVKSKVPSTIVICDEELILVREGGIPFDKIKEIWEKE